MHFVCPSLDACYPQEMLSFLSGQAASVLYLWCSTLTPSSSSYWSYSTEHLGAAQQRFNSWGGDNYTWCTPSPRYKPNRFSAALRECSPWSHIKRNNQFWAVGQNSTSKWDLFLSHRSAAVHDLSFGQRVKCSARVIIGWMVEKERQMLKKSTMPSLHRSSCLTRWVSSTFLSTLDEWYRFGCNSAFFPPNVSQVSW